MVATHNYAVPGIYRVGLFTATTPCAPPPPAAGGQAPPPNIYGVTIQACIWVGPGTPGAASCPALSGEIG
jgi:hypothetical protein